MVYSLKNQNQIILYIKVLTQDISGIQESHYTKIIRHQLQKYIRSQYKTYPILNSQPRHVPILRTCLT